MKLYVVGESSPNPEDWSAWSEFVLVLASSKDEALALCEGYGPIAVTEVPMDEPRVLVAMQEPQHGEDI